MSSWPTAEKRKFPITCFVFNSYQEKVAQLTSLPQVQKKPFSEDPSYAINPKSHADGDCGKTQNSLQDHLRALADPKNMVRFDRLCLVFLTEELINFALRPCQDKASFQTQWVQHQTTKHTCRKGCCAVCTICGRSTSRTGWLLPEQFTLKTSLSWERHLDHFPLDS